MRVAALLLLSTLAAAAQQYRAFWADAFHNGIKTPAQVDQLVEDLAAARANAVFAQVRRRGDSYYLRTLEPPAPDPQYSPSFDALQYLIERAHARGIEVHAWFTMLPVGTSTDPRHVYVRHGPSAQGNDMWMSVSAAGGMSGSLDPGHPDVLRYTADVVLEPARHYDLDGLHLDYIRYAEDADYGWNPAAVERFQRLANRTGRPDPRDPAWSAFRRDQVTRLVRQIYLRAFAIRPSIKISAALITWGNGPLNDAEYRARDAYSRVFQDWRGWLEEGILDLGMPMNYFRETAQYAPMFDRWIEYEKDRQYNRFILPGPAIYLNPVPDSMAQLARVMAPSAAGNHVPGVCFYSYAVTNSGTTPNDEFYRAAAQFFGEPVKPPALPWKEAPTRGHLSGTLQVEGGPAWLADGADIIIESDTGPFTYRTTTDATGFFGAVDLPPDRYRVRLERGGRELFRATPQDVAAGGLARFELRLKAEDFAPVIPRVAAVLGRTAAAPGDLVRLTGAAFAAEPSWAVSVPLPQALGRTQVLVNGVAAPLFSVSPGVIEMQLPYAGTDWWAIVVRHAGLESEPFYLQSAAASPVILGAGKREGWLEIAAIGLGAVAPPIAAGAGSGAEEPFHRAVLPVAVLFGSAEAQPSYAGLVPWYPGRYQVNVRVPEGWTSGNIRLRVGEYLSPPFYVD